MRQEIRRLVVLVSCIALGASGCTSTSRVWMGDTTAAAALPKAGRGDGVLLVLREGSSRNCPVQGYDADYFYGCRDPVAMENIREVRFRRFDGEKVITLPDLEKGHAVTVQTRSGGIEHFRLAAVDADSLQGEGVEVALSEVADMHATRHPLEPGARSLLTGFGAVFLAIGAIALYAMSRGWGHEE